MILHLGVIEQQYDNSESYEKAKNKAYKYGKAKAGNIEAPAIAAPMAKTTFDVAERLEAKYHVMELFFEEVGVDLIAKALEHSVNGAIQNVLMGAPVADEPLSPSKQGPVSEAMSEVEAAFKHFLSLQFLDGVARGVPTQAALMGVNHRMKHPYANRPPRPSFIDTGLYQANFKAWID
jgi:hypothetical protein